MNDIENMNKEELISFAKEFNIFKTYTFESYAMTRNSILNRMNELGITENEVYPERNCDPNTISFTI